MDIREAKIAALAGLVSNPEWGSADEDRRMDLWTDAIVMVESVFEDHPIVARTAAPSWEDCIKDLIPGGEPYRREYGTDKAAGVTATRLRNRYPDLTILTTGSWVTVRRSKR